MRSAGSQCKAKAVLKRVIRPRWAKSDKQLSVRTLRPFTYPARLKSTNAASQNFMRRAQRNAINSRCPLCGHLQVLRLQEMDFETATCRCNACGQPHGQDQWQSEPGQWIAENPGVTRRGFWLNCFVSPFIRWEVVFAEFRETVHRKRPPTLCKDRATITSLRGEVFAVNCPLQFFTADPYDVQAASLSRPASTVIKFDPVT